MNDFSNKLKIFEPLPKFLTIKKSPIHGLGLFAIEEINKNTLLGITHIKDDRFLHGYIRTPLGGFFNHSISPNCKAIYDEDLIKLKTIKNISINEELTVNYELHQWCNVK
ncbi:MAG: SET domain-containing protein [Hydrogenophilales bacterium]